MRSMPYCWYTNTNTHLHSGTHKHTHTHIHTNTHTQKHWHTHTTYLCNSLQAHVIPLAFSLLQFLQRHSHLTDKLVAAETVHVTHAEPEHTHTHTHTGGRGTVKSALVKPWVYKFSASQVCVCLFGSENFPCHGSVRYLSVCKSIFPQGF